MLSPRLGIRCLLGPSIRGDFYVDLKMLTLGLVSPIKPPSYPYVLGDVCSIFLTTSPHSVFIYDFRATEAIEGLSIGLSDGICVSKHL